MKVLHESCMEHADSAALDGLRKEAEMLQSLHHPNIINFYGACFEGKQARGPLLGRGAHGLMLMLTFQYWQSPVLTVGFAVLRR